ncbi:stage V sporulation protein AC [Intestinibacillus massiliensis]|uniref:stage V sporulation protein AC n=1 Tax=Intestinibacillus massiliensis TaxID=1871029 RepID=UPI000B34D694|nr:stage V sporulation protein AC [Intestinibacillus massiliensis]MCB6366096.1 stage V sporulation protein AC [Intestinibacillus massiliensis]
MHVSKDEYDALLKQKSPNSPILKDILWAAVIGGLICTAGQGILNLYKMAGLPEKDAATATSITLIFLGALLTGLGWYDKLAKHAGAGTIVPITGFSNAVVAPALEFKSEGLVLGMAAKMFTIAGPVLVYGISASVVYGLVVYVFHLA